MLNSIKYSILRLHKLSHLRLFVNNLCDKIKDEEKIIEKKVEKKEEKPKVGINRLNQLLASMSTDENTVLLKKVQMPKAKKEKKKAVKKQESDSDSDDEKPKDLIHATKKVAETLGGDIKKTESELLSKLLSNSESSEGNLNDLISGMMVDKKERGPKEADTQTKAQYVRKMMDRGQSGSYQRDGQSGPYQREKRPPATSLVKMSGPSVDLFGGEGLNIFKDTASLNDSPDILKTWKKLEDRELRLAVTHPPANYFQKMALWTEQGKLWKFPIDNEQGRDAEHNISFVDHVFLEEHLEPWCPRKGPIRHFMELVCVGLGKNHFITAAEKKEHIMWYKDYFEQKKDLLQAIIIQGKDGEDKIIEK